MSTPPTYVENSLNRVFTIKLPGLSMVHRYDFGSLPIKQTLVGCYIRLIQLSKLGNVSIYGKILNKIRSDSPKGLICVYDTGSYHVYLINKNHALTQHPLIMEL